LRAKESRGREFFLPRILICSDFTDFSISFSIFCLSSSNRLCSSTIDKRSSASFLCASSIFLSFSSIILSSVSRFFRSSSYRKGRQGIRHVSIIWWKQEYIAMSSRHREHNNIQQIEWTTCQSVLTDLFKGVRSKIINNKCRNIIVEHKSEQQLMLLLLFHEWDFQWNCKLSVTNH